MAKVVNAPKYWTKLELAEFHRVSEFTIDRWVKDGKLIPAYHTPGGAPRFHNPEPSV